MEMRSRCINRLEEDKAIMATFQAAATREIAKPDMYVHLLSASRGISQDRLR